MTIDKSWTLLHKNSIEYWNGLQTFLLRCKNYLNFEGKCRCPCRKCNNVDFGTIDSLECHIHSNGFSKAYKIWIYHGEPMVSTVACIPQTTNEMHDALNVVLQENTNNEHDINTNENNNEPTEVLSATNVVLDDLFTLANTELYPGCDWMSSLDFLAKISHMKAINHWSDTSFDQILELLRFAFPKDNELPKSHYEAKKLMKKVELGVRRASSSSVVLAGRSPCVGQTTYTQAQVNALLAKQNSISLAREARVETKLNTLLRGLKDNNIDIEFEKKENEDEDEDEDDGQD